MLTKRSIQRNCRRLTSSSVTDMWAILASCRTSGGSIFLLSAAGLHVEKPRGCSLRSELLQWRRPTAQRLAGVRTMRLILEAIHPCPAMPIQRCNTNGYLALLARGRAVDYVKSY